MEEWHVPGVAVGAIKDGAVVLLEGYGYRDLESKLPVTPRTLMAIGSNSKSFTVVLMAQLVDNGQLDWDAPVRDFLPSFRLHDDYATSNMRVRDLVTHVSGLPRHDLLWYGRSLDRQALFDRLKYLEPTTSFRGRWQYQNLMFMTAGYLVERITGHSWDALIDERIFTPLGMTRSNTSVTVMPQSDDFAYPYLLLDGELTRVPFRNIDNVGPAGSINSSVEEMLSYIQLHLDSGVVAGDTILSERNAVLMQTAQSAVGSQDQYPEIGPATYALGLGVTTYRGHKQVSHGGGIDGFISAIGWLPNDGIGVMVLSNMSGEANPVPTLIQRRVFDELLALEPIDWSARVRKDYEDGRQRQEEERNKRAAERIAGTSPSHALDAFTGAYEHPAYGRMEVTVRDSALQLRYDQFEVDLEHYHYDVFEVKGSGPDAALAGRVQFLMAVDGKIDRLAAPLEPALDPIVFRRVQEEK
ncbi:MAG: hypothetical protein AMS18_11420 [Gemmatimonas sp. SG8_17]|nr:MAG: hypothetical protein AMS18_11420 [Gemmatimonas sp. SG8_17]